MGYQSQALPGRDICGCPQGSPVHCLHVHEGRQGRGRNERPDREGRRNTELIKRTGCWENSVLFLKSDKVWLQINFYLVTRQNLYLSKLLLIFHLNSHISYWKMTKWLLIGNSITYFFLINHNSFPSMDPHSQSLTLKRKKNPNEASSQQSKAPAHRDCAPMRKDTGAHEVYIGWFLFPLGWCSYVYFTTINKNSPFCSLVNFTHIDFFKILFLPWQIFKQYILNVQQILFLGCMACGILVPQSEIKPVSPALQGRFLMTRPPGKSPHVDC